jgi:hypothetical protein
LARTVEIDDGGGHGITLPRAIRDRFAHQLVRQWRRQFLDGDEALGPRSKRSTGENGRPDSCRKKSGRNWSHALSLKLFWTAPRHRPKIFFRDRAKDNRVRDEVWAGPRD